MALHPARLPVALVCRACHMHCEAVAISASDGIELRGWYYTSDYNLTSHTQAIILFTRGQHREICGAWESVTETRIFGAGARFARAWRSADGDLRVWKQAHFAWLDWLEKTGPRLDLRIRGIAGGVGLAGIADARNAISSDCGREPVFDFYSVRTKGLPGCCPQHEMDGRLSWTRA